MNNEPVAWYKKNSNDYLIENIGQPSFQVQEFIDAGYIPLYTHPVKEFNDGGEPVKNATYWKRQYNLMATQNDNLKSGLYHANEQIKYLESHPVKELTDEEINQAIRRGFARDGFLSDGIFLEIKELLRKASEK